VRPSRVQSWVLATRPKTLPAAVVPVLAGTAVAHHEGANIHPWVFTATLVAALLIQVATNFANDYSDFLRGADNDGRLGPLRVTQSGLLSPGAVRGGILIAIVLALLLGGYLAWVGRWPVALRLSRIGRRVRVRFFWRGRRDGNLLSADR
jgi:1,4-dihydroxy-2-naphthoate octaprenyltransferase